MDLSVEGKVYLNGVFEKCCIGVTNGKISEIKKILKADEHYNFGNKLIFPSGVDSHVHFRDPGMLHKEDFSTGSMAAAFGGITCVFDMPNTIPQTSTIQSLDDKIISAERKSYIDFGVHAGINNENISEIPLMSTRCNGFKIYLGSTTLSLLFEKSRINQAFKEVSKTGKPIFFPDVPGRQDI